MHKQRTRRSLFSTRVRRTARVLVTLYERHDRVALRVAVGLFLAQLIHLYWLTTHVVTVRLFQISAFPTSRLWEVLLAVVDYAEIPALLSASLVYIHALRKQPSFRSTALLLLVNTQWLHILWITDEFITRTAAIPPALAWIAIVIDYLEVPVIFDLLRTFAREVMNGRLERAVGALAGREPDVPQA